MENPEINNNVKRGRGRPKKNSPPIVKPAPKKAGRPKIREHRYENLKISFEEYNKLKEIESKYYEVLKVLNNI